MKERNAIVMPITYSGSKDAYMLLVTEGEKWQRRKKIVLMTMVALTPDEKTKLTQGETPQQILYENYQRLIQENES
jgi:hypothetical protein